jgi:hypothetical protein
MLQKNAIVSCSIMIVKFLKQDVFYAYGVHLKFAVTNLGASKSNSTTFPLRSPGAVRARRIDPLVVNAIACWLARATRIVKSFI